MAAPIARVRINKRALRTEELSSLETVPHRFSTSAETSPFRHATAPIAAEATEQFGQYLVYEQLGEGGMAYVHRAEMVGAAGFRKPVALKRMRTATSENPEFVTSFITEGRVIGRLRHPNIASAYELGKLDNTYFIAMEYVPGPTLAQIMAQSRRAAGAIPLPIVLEILIQLCDALEHAHDLRDEGGHPLNLIHRDISPMNVIVSRAGTAKLIDFGIAKLRGSAVVTQAGIIKGKHAYVAPEYTLGTGLDRRVDLWGLGVVAHEMLTGRRLFLGDTDGETIRNVRTMPITPPSRIANGVSPELDDIVMTALQRDPDLRWQNAGAMRAALTAEARRLRQVVSGAQIREWIEWAFRQPTRQDSPIGHVVDQLQDDSPSIQIVSGDLEPVSSASAISANETSGEIDDELPTLDRATPAPVHLDRALRPTPRYATQVPSLGGRRARIATGTVPPADPPRLTPGRGVRATPGFGPERVTPAFGVRRPSRPGREDTAPTVDVKQRAASEPIRLERRRGATPTPAPLAIVPASSAPIVARGQRPPSSDGVPHPVPHSPTTKVRPLDAPNARPTPPRRDISHHGAPRWRPPTRWTAEPPRSQFPQLFVLLLLAAFAAMSVQLGWIDVAAWRQLLGV